jgi:hypothetical protein
MAEVNRPVFARIQARASAIEERCGGAERRRQLLHGLSGRVLEVGAGGGVSFAHYPSSVSELIAIEPESALRERALRAAEAAAVPVRVLDEAACVLRADGELRFYEHVIARNPRLRTLQRVLDATFWPGLLGGCHTNRDTEVTIRASGFAIEERERFSFRPTLFATPVAPRILGRASRRRAGSRSASRARRRAPASGRP